MLVRSGHGMISIPPLIFRALAFLLLFAAIHLDYASAETLTPPYFNLAEGRKIHASATCGEGTEGPELYCKLMGTNAQTDLDVNNVIQGQLCDVCDPTRPDKEHPPSHAVDGMETWWQSPPLSRGMKYNEVNLTIDLGQEFHVAYVFIRMGISPRPGLWVLEKSADYGKTYTPWQYFSDSPDDCATYFGKDSLQPITRDDSVICTTEYSKIVPLEGGEIPISLLNNRPSANHYFNSTVLQEWTRATNVKLRLLRTKNLLGHLMSVARQDPTVTRRYFYSIKDISIGGRCMCNGHADTCDIQDEKDPSILWCRCQHNTCGAKCDSCCPGYEQKKWQQSKANHRFVCEPCNCFQHSRECTYDEEIDRQHLSLDVHGRYEGGGVCQNCQHNTEGINCNKCKPTFYRPYNKHWNETDVCRPCSCDFFYSTGNCAEGSGQCECKKEFTPPRCDSCSFGYFGYPDCRPCECFLNGTRDLQCEASNGQCPCLHNFGGQYCKECAPGYYNYSTCQPCECNSQGSVSHTCDQLSGNCTCKSNFGGKQCDQCQDGYFNYPSCQYCSCDIKGTQAGICDKSNGQCICKPGYGGARCDTCLLGYYGYPDCQPCNCTKLGSLASTCSAVGKCNCLSNYAGKTCDQCSPGYYAYPDCLPCACDSIGSNGVTCDSEGKCECHPHYAGQHCDSCREGFYNYPACEDCNCHPAGVVAGFAGCGSVPAGELCQCKERVEGRICDKCKPLYWNLHVGNPQGCEECNCHVAGTLAGMAVCDAESGQCVCKELVVARGCAECADGSYDLQEDNLFGCSDCECDVGGAINNICNKQSGQCLCQPRVTGRTCKQPLKAHYFPSLYQYQYEVEDGRTPTNTLVRYAHDDRVFPNYSWKGYAVFSLLQNRIIQDVYIHKPSLYRMVLRYVNTNPEPVLGLIKATPDNPGEIDQEIQVLFRNTSGPEFVTVSGPLGLTPAPFVMNPGRWQISIEVHKNLLLDYFVLLPEDFYLASVLNKRVDKPCTLNETDLCRDYSYLNVTQFDTTYGVGGYVQNGRKIDQLKEFFQDTEHLAQINVGNRVPLLNLAQPSISFNITVSKPDRYVLVINYVTPLGDLRTHRINAQIQSTGRQTSNATAILYACPYTTLCRQTLTTPEGGVAVVDVSGNEIKLDLESSNAEVGVHSVVAIPYSEWSLGFIKPKSVCIKKDGKCIPTSFRTPPESKKIQFEENNLDNATTLQNVSYIWLNPDFNTLDLKGKVPASGYYTFVVHYYQPNYQDFELSILLQNGQFYEATVPVHHCPALSGCRSVIAQSDGNNRFSLTENFMLTVKNPTNKTVYLDYLFVIPTDLYNPRYLDEEDVDRTGEFVATCGNNHFAIDITQPGFCRDAVFSITAGHNSGALPCQCDYDGSLSFECDKYGGQCQCKPNIIGRKCEACRTGFYGFPDCKPCNCPSTAYCEPNTGQCICPPHVTGERCDQCEPLTYGFDPIIGCEQCKCHPVGVAGSMQCDLNNGSCPCRAHVVGRQCDQCQPGHFSFPYCPECSCDTRGTTEAICDQTTAECFCKRNVMGASCEFCREGTFNLQESNAEDGCTECFCFGKSSRCASSRLIQISLVHMEDWSVAAVNATGPRLEVARLKLAVQNIDNDAIGVDFTKGDAQGGAANTTSVYFVAPRQYTGKKLTAYGGYLNYTVFYTIGTQGSALYAADVILEGKKTYLTYSSFEQPPQNVEFMASVQLVETNFLLPNLSPAKRNHIMEVLEDLQAVYIRATYWSASETTRLLSVAQDEAISQQQFGRDSRNLKLAESVEECMCPPNYQGLSCEECAPGYYRTESGPHGGYCVPCQCHGHASECDVRTGVCFNCTHNTRGDHCEQCEVGYHGNALAGTARDCLICACPLPIATNNFAAACDVSADGEKISCECNEGYIGARCQSCGPGFFGRPEYPGDYCKPCQCSGNIDEDDPSSCDTVTGECLRCLNNTFGKACALCAPGYFGDAIGLKDCQSCICDDLGTDHCNSFTGECVCKPNVIGEKCDRCALEHYGFQSGAGCVPCECAEASDSDQCEDTDGQCRCKPGVTGRSCDRCVAGYWNYTANGCVSCGCKSEYSLGFGCNALTGQCECLRGVIGEKCDQCPYRWVFVQDDGCHQCDSCSHALLDTTDALSALIDPVISEFDAANSGYFTRRKLESMREQLKTLQPKFDEVDPKQIVLEPHIANLEALEQESKNLHRKANYSLVNSDSLQTTSEELKENAEELFDTLSETESDAIAAIDRIQDMTQTQIKSAEEPETEAAVQEAEEMLERIREYNLTVRETAAADELVKVEALLENVTNFRVPVDSVANATAALKNDTRRFSDVLDDLYNQTQYSLNKANEAQRIIDKSGIDRLKKKLNDIDAQTVESKDNLVLSAVLNDNTTRFNENLLEIAEELADLLEAIEIRNSVFNNSLNLNDAGIDDVRNIQPNVTAHAQNLTERAMTLDNLFTETRDLSGQALRAAKAYGDIVEAVENAREAAAAANEDAQNAVDMLEGIENRTFVANSDSSSALTKAFDLYHSTNDELRPALLRSRRAHEPIRMLADENRAQLEEINRIQAILRQQQPLDKSYRKAAETADNAVGHVTSIIDDKSEDPFSKLPSESEKAKSLPKSVDDIQRDMIQTEKQLTSVNEKLPELIERIDQLPEKQDNLQASADNIQKSIALLNQQIALARSMANQIEIGMKFYANTSLELRNPPNLEDLSTSTHISGYFRTEKPYSLVLYLGNPEGTVLKRAHSDDYMALTIQNGYPVLKFDVGNGAEQINHPKYVADNLWRQFIIDKTGHTAKLTIREEFDDHKETVQTEEKPIDGDYSIFNLDRNQSKLFVGGVPSHYSLQPELTEESRSAFEGELEHVVVGDEPVSLWNFEDGEENNHGAFERDRLRNLQPGSGLRFNGNGYVILAGRTYPIRAKSDVQLKFKTFATEGLLFLIGKEKTFIALELRNGKLLYQYNLGQGTKKWATSKTYNDGIWHVVKASRDGATGRFVVDDEDIPDNNQTISGNSIEQVEYISFGGHSSPHHFNEVTNTKFDGCVDDVIIMGSHHDLTNNVRAYDVTPGCPAKIARLLSFAKSKPGYIIPDTFSVSNDLKINLKFKTKQRDGLLFYVTDKLHTANISLALKNGHLVLISQKIELTSKETFNDSEWHVVSITHNPEKLRIDFDDTGYKVTDSPPPPLHILHGTLYIGGVPMHVRLSPGTVGSESPFAGCIGDLTINGNVINFANVTHKRNEIIGKCLLDEHHETVDHSIPTLPPIGPRMPQTESPDESVATCLEDDSECGPKGTTLRGGDGGYDFDFHTTTVKTVPVVETRAPPRTQRPNYEAGAGGKVGRPEPTTPKPVKEGCALPLEPEMDHQSAGSYRLGTQKPSRLEFESLRGKHKKQFDLTLEFKTDALDGVLFYISDGNLQESYEALILEDGYVKYTFSSRGNSASRTSEERFNDNRWHYVEIVRNEGNGTLVIDNDFTYQTESPKIQRVDIKAPLYVGGVEPNNLVTRNVNITESLKGCIRNINMNTKPLEKPKKIGVIPCSDVVEPGTFFPASGGFVKLKQRCHVGEEFNIKLDIKARADSGVLIGVHGRKDYFVLEMDKGVMRLTVENGVGPITASFKPKTNYYFCDGQWHTIQAVKSKNVVTLSVDNVFTEPSLGDHSSRSTDTGSALFLGGHRYITRARGILSKKPFVGCIRNVFLNNDPMEITPAMTENHGITVGFCPTN